MIFKTVYKTIYKIGWMNDETYEEFEKVSNYLEQQKDKAIKYVLNKVQRK